MGSSWGTLLSFPVAWVEAAWVKRASRLWKESGASVRMSETVGEIRKVGGGLVGALFLVLILAGVTPLRAQEGHSTVATGVDAASQYFFRGIVQETKGLILQPWIEIETPVTPAGSPVDFDFTIGLWNSLHTGNTGTGGRTTDPRLWFEFDFYAGLSASSGDWTGSLTYNALSSPNDSFRSVQDLSLGFRFDDSGHWGAGFGGWRPSVHVLFETQGQTDGGNGSGTYLEVGIEPGMAAFDTGVTSIEITVPVTLGLSLDDYYEDLTGDDEGFGFLDVGIAASMPLTMLPEHLGNWTVTAGVHLLVLGNHTREYNGGDDFEVITTIGISNVF